MHTQHIDMSCRSKFLRGQRSTDLGLGVRNGVKLDLLESDMPVERKTVDCMSCDLILLERLLLVVLPTP